MNRMLFRNYGGNYQLRLENAGDLALIQDLKVARVLEAGEGAGIGP